ncbi:hypothetical protein BV898_16206 [Hypsibius exemplaris]|uniref:Uncharacterized protein n=1 Tax=Hypsibius exemplaris TaxID=2072580 RepID=A0A9X6NCQ2_HYPEX|nr:hypothetical protein BV898_16206 [Hypsibius exemplaris]
MCGDDDAMQCRRGRFAVISCTGRSVRSPQSRAERQPAEGATSRSSRWVSFIQYPDSSNLPDSQPSHPHISLDLVHSVGAVFVIYSVSLWQWISFLRLASAQLLTATLMSFSPYSDAHSIERIEISDIPQKLSDLN